MEEISRDPMRLIYYLMLIEKVESKFVCERSEQTYFLRSKVKAFYSYQNSRAKIFYLRDCARADLFRKTTLMLRVRVRVRDLRARCVRAQEILARSSLWFPF